MRQRKNRNATEKQMEIDQKEKEQVRDTGQTYHKLQELLDEKGKEYQPNEKMGGNTSTKQVDSQIEITHDLNMEDISSKVMKVAPTESKTSSGKEKGNMKGKGKQEKEKRGRKDTRKFVRSQALSIDSTESRKSKREQHDTA
ncbi:hypothetical protein K7X08_029928 [Anisodus acutangulus]|uniref:Uncharacterized protein n=1 Tax=Anisodus acutangulus TaxID=402998 RepID=A0A9Q1R3T7_9SOLA|nr:hypothetical protein K7X08_029928 [Anisodus acutangulus]